MALSLACLIDLHLSESHILCTVCQYAAATAKQTKPTHTTDSHLEHDRAVRPDIAGAGVLPPLPDIARQVLHRAAELDALAALQLVEERRKAKVAEHEVAPLVEEDVGGLEVAVDDAAGVDAFDADELERSVR